MDRDAEILLLHRGVLYVKVRELVIEQRQIMQRRLALHSLFIGYGLGAAKDNKPMPNALPRPMPLITACLSFTASVQISWPSNIAALNR